MEHKKQEPSITSYLIKYALIGLGIQLVLTIFQQVFHLYSGLENTIMYSVVSVGLILIMDVVYILMMVITVKNYKRDNGGFISLGKALVLSFLVGFLIAVGIQLMVYIYSLVFETMHEYHPSYLLIALFKNSLIGILVALIVSLFLRKKRMSPTNDV